MNIKIYTLDTCVYCNLAKDILKKNNLKYEEIKLEKNNDNLKKLIEKTKCKTVPQIFVNENFIGGYTDLKELIEKGILNK